ncbi:hypothetical protein [Haloferax sp. DFSO52]|uniref:hypothetical protein n=1 Tax=Haloferax sp. DFSO52 TaxID=3388505 RepID=UPI003A857DE9
MWVINKENLDTIVSVVVRLKRRIVRDLTLDLRDGSEWAKDNVSRGLAFLIEKWIGFWLTMILLSIVGAFGGSIVDVARWATDVPVIVDWVPWSITLVAVFGILTVFTTGIILFGVIAVSAVRLLFWIRDRFQSFWNRHTPPFEQNEAESVTHEWPRSTHDVSKSMEKVKSFTFLGSICFMLVTSALVAIEVTYRESFYATLSTPALSPISETLNPTLWIINVSGLMSIIAPYVTQTQVVLLILLIGIPGILLTIVARNLLFIIERAVRKSIETVRQEGIVGWAGLKLVSVLVIVTTTAFNAGLVLLTGN